MDALDSLRVASDKVVAKFKVSFQERKKMHKKY